VTHRARKNEPATDAGDGLVQRIQGLLDEAQALDNEARARDRFPICGALQLVPVDFRGKLLGDQTLKIFAKNLSTTGISFTHELPLSFRRAVIVLDYANTELAVEVEILWTKLTGTGLYETGCRLIRKIDGHDAPPGR
jgi:hypothetical protein